MSLARVAAATRMSKGHISNIENGLVLINVRSLENMAICFRIPSYFLLLDIVNDPLSVELDRIRLEHDSDVSAMADRLRAVHGAPRKGKNKKD